jgi:ribosome-binding protein aMBF1 (putative translation factor)
MSTNRKKQRNDADDLEARGVGESLAGLKGQLLRDQEFRAAYEELGPEFEMIASLIELRRQRGLSQEELAQAVGTRQPAIARIESGRYRGMSVATLEKLAKALKAKLVIRFEDADQTGV